MKKNNQIKNPWPPCCCVAAFVTAALSHFGYSVADRRTIAMQLGIRVGPDKDNPWDLPIEEDFNLQGLLVADAKRRLPKILKQYDKSLGFRHIPFHFVTLKLFEDVFGEAISKECVVAIGFNNSIIRGDSGILRHLARIKPHSNHRNLILLDDSYGVPPLKTIVDWEMLAKAVYSVDDGFWIIGHLDQLTFEFAPLELIENNEENTTNRK